jgi:hypothetical protein
MLLKFLTFFFVNVAQDIGKEYTFNKNDHPSLQKIEDKNFVKNSFEFKSTNETFVSKVIDKFNVKKATDVDKTSVKWGSPTHIPDRWSIILYPELSFPLRYTTCSVTETTTLDRER